MGAEIKYTSFRPYFSDSGAEMMGPKPRPSVYKERPRMAAVRETWNCDVIEVSAGA